MKIKIKVEKRKIEVEAELNDTETAKKIYEKLPIKGEVNRWGDEIYFEIPLSLSLDKGNSKQDMEIGDLAYWPQGNAFCIFFGKTPASINQEPRAISPVNFIGRIKNIKDIKIFRKAIDGDKIVLSK
jgi:hypothetical protein